MADNGRSSTRRRPTRAQTRQRVLEAAAVAFNDGGFAGTSLDQVAALAGLTKGAIYSSFGSKDQLFYALIRDQIDERLRLSTSSDPASTLHDVAEDAGRALSRADTQHPDWHLTFVEFWVRAMRSPELLTDFRAHRRASRAVIADHLGNEARRLGVSLPMPAEQLAVLILALSNGLAIELLADPEAGDPTLLTRALEALLTSGAA